MLIERNYQVIFLEPYFFNTIPKIEEHMLIVTDKSTHEKTFLIPANY